MKRPMSPVYQPARRAPVPQPVGRIASNKNNVWIHLSRHMLASASVLSVLADVAERNGDLSLMISVASHANTDAATLDRIQQSEWSSTLVQKRLAGHPNTPAEILYHLADAASGQYESTLAQNLSTPVEILERILLSGGYAAWSVLSNPALPASSMRRAIKTAGTSTELLGIASYLAVNPELPEDVWHQVSEIIGQDRLREVIPTSPYIDSELLRSWWVSADEGERAVLAWNPSTPKELIMRGARGGDVRRSLGLLRAAQSYLPAEDLFAAAQGLHFHAEAVSCLVDAPGVLPRHLLTAYRALRGDWDTTTTPRIAETPAAKATASKLLTHPSMPVQVVLSTQSTPAVTAARFLHPEIPLGVKMKNLLGMRSSTHDEDGEETNLLSLLASDVFEGYDEYIGREHPGLQGLPLEWQWEALR